MSISKINSINTINNVRLSKYKYFHFNNDNHTNINDNYNINYDEIIVTDYDYQILSIDNKSPIKLNNSKIVYDSVLEAYTYLSSCNKKDNYKLMYYLNYEKFKTYKHAKDILCSTDNKYIVYKSSDDYLGMTVPDFEGENIVGQILQIVRHNIQEIILDIDIDI